MKKHFICICCCLAALLTSCDDTTDTLGSSLTSVHNRIQVSDGVFSLQSRSVLADSVLTGNSRGYLGCIKDPETGVYVRSNFAAQFFTVENYEFPKRDSLYSGIKADSCELRLFFTKTYGDSLSTMKATLYEMAKPLEEGVDYYSTFNPAERGYLRTVPGALKVSKVYTAADCNLPDSVRKASGYVPHLSFSLNDEYTDRDGRKYDNYGTYILQKYYDDPSNFKNSYNFIHNVCPGVYVKLDNGVGSLSEIYLSQLLVYFSFHDKGKVQHGYAIFVGTEEVRQFTEVQGDKQRLSELIAQNNCTYIKTPVGVMTEFTIPVEEVCKGHENDSISLANITIPCYAKTDKSGSAYDAPGKLLMVETDSLKSFFEKHKVVDHRRTFVAEYTKQSNNYTFGNIGELVHLLHSALPAGESERAAWKAAHPNWNKVTLVPVNVSYNTVGQSNVMAKVAHDMSLSGVRLVGGADCPDGKVEMSVIYTKFYDVEE